MSSSNTESCTEVEMTPTQCNAVIEDKLTHLLPVAQNTLAIFLRVEDALKNGEIDWRKAFKRAKRRVVD